MTKVMTEVGEIFDKGHMTGTEGGILHSEEDPKGALIQESYTENKTFIEIEIEVTIDRCLGINVDDQLEDLELHQGL